MDLHIFNSIRYQPNLYQLEIFKLNYVATSYKQDGCSVLVAVVIIIAVEQLVN